MSKRRQAQESPSNHTPQRKPQNVNRTPEPEELQRAVFDKGSADSQAAQLQRPQMAQRQAMVSQVGQVQGNRAAQRLVSLMRQTEDPGGKELEDGGSAQQSVQKGLESGGQPLPDDSREFFESRMGYDFSGVRLHNDETADEAAQSINAKAFTVGQDVVLGQDAADPGSAAGKELLAHELTHVVQQGGAGAKDVQRKADISQRGGPRVSRWGGAEHRDLGNAAATMALEHSDKLKISTDVAYAGGKKSMPLGDATKLAGDHSASPDELGKLKSTRVDETFSMPGLGHLPHYIGLASTNINHFFPLADKEWHTQHARAMQIASAARQAYAQGKKKLGDRLTQIAIRTEAFSLHFLQDSYASGHQYPRALEAIDAWWSTTAYKGLTNAKTYHDALCALPGGLDMAVGGKFHGDGTMQIDGADKRVAQESYNSLAQVLGTIAGTSPQELGAQTPVVNPGPDVGKIMQDPDAAPIWYSMEQSLSQKRLEKGRKNKGGTIKTDSGLSYSPSDVVKSWDGRKGGDTQKLKDSPDLVTKLIDSSLKGTSQPSNFGADNNILKLLSNKDGVLDVNVVPGTLTVNQTVMLCETLISGACIGKDEHAVLFILRRQRPEVFREAVKKLTFDKIDSGLDGKEWDTFLLVAANRFQAGSNEGAKRIAKEKNDDAARMLITGGQGEKPVPMNRLSPQEWIGVIRALLSGACLNPDEDAIVRIVSYLAGSGHAGLVNSEIGKDTMDSGVDGKQWRQLKKLMNW